MKKSFTTIQDNHAKGTFRIKWQKLGRFHLMMDTIDRRPLTGDKGIYLKQQLKDKLIEHKQYINKQGQDMPEIRNCKWVSVMNKLFKSNSQHQAPQCS